MGIQTHSTKLLVSQAIFSTLQSNEHLEYMIQYNIIAVMDTQHRHEEFFEADRKMLPRGKKRK